MKAATLIRYYQDDSHTLGCFSIQGLNDPVFWTLEQPWRGNETNVSCIPAGTYLCLPFSGSIYQNVYALQDVPGRSAILIHPGNYVRATRGCILPGLSTGYMKDGGVEATPEKAVMSSQAALNRIKQLMNDEPFMLTIIGGTPPGWR